VPVKVQSSGADHGELRMKASHQLILTMFKYSSAPRQLASGITRVRKIGPDLFVELARLGLP